MATTVSLEAAPVGGQGHRGFDALGFGSTFTPEGHVDEQQAAKSFLASDPRDHPDDDESSA
ncbi:MAG TPA: hypothetical protein VFR23_12795 [Jiangellaceae bacterium]|nr:hypothetical protein [Jiangellaceae bacterium]